MAGGAGLAIGRGSGHPDSRHSRADGRVLFFLAAQYMSDATALVLIDMVYLVLLIAAILMLQREASSLPRALNR
jgi:hypothetical protein